jgi:hypothetical protein
VQRTIDRAVGTVHQKWAFKRLTELMLNHAQSWAFGLSLTAFWLSFRWECLAISCKYRSRCPDYIRPLGSEIMNNICMALQFGLDDIISISTVHSNTNDMITTCALFEYRTIWICAETLSWQLPQRGYESHRSRFPSMQYGFDSFAFAFERQFRYAD